MMGSDWLWELEVPAAAETALRELFVAAAERGLRPQRPDGLINIFDDSDAGLRTVQDLEAALDAMARNNVCGQLWTSDGSEVLVEWVAGSLTWALDSAYCYRRPTPEAEAFRELHARLTDLWLNTAQTLNAKVGRVLDEWSSDQVWHLGIHEAVHPSGGWPAELGWWTYLDSTLDVPEPPLQEVAARTRQLANGALLVCLLDDPAAVDPLRYENIHTRWCSAIEPR
jgi:hypothetical protein